MSVGYLKKSGYGQVELNQVAWRRDGRIEAQCALDATTDFATSLAENGMLLAVDKLKGVVYKAKAAHIGVLPIGLHYSTEHMYDERALGLEHFALSKDDFYPRVGYLSIGDVFTTNLFAYDASTYVDRDAVVTALEDIETTPVYGIINDAAPGHIFLATDISSYTAGPLFKVVKLTTMPDGQDAVKLQVFRV